MINATTVNIPQLNLHDDTRSKQLRRLPPLGAEVPYFPFTAKRPCSWPAFTADLLAADSPAEALNLMTVGRNYRARQWIHYCSSSSQPSTATG
jgi:hypothetical protein